MTHPYDALTPDLLLDAVDAAGWRPDGRLLALNSYENRVYQVGLEDGDWVIAKFYRPERWTDAAIREEHAFAGELAAAEIPMVAPLADAAGQTLLFHAGFRFALFPRRGGRPPELEDPEVLERIGRFLGRIHMVGSGRQFTERPRLDVREYGWGARGFLLESAFVPASVRAQFGTLTEEVLTGVEEGFSRAGAVAEIRLHGDCHPGNILWTDAGPHFVDLDDCRTGPAVQDLWMLLSGDRKQMSLQLGDILEGYEEFHDFDRRELHLIEPLRALRMIAYAAWVARRWDDPAFPRAFPWFGTDRWWEEQVNALREQIGRMEQPPLLV